MKIRRFLSNIFFLAIAAFYIVLRFSHPDMTDVRFVLTYWWQIAAAIILTVAVAAWSMQEAPKAKN